MEKNIVKFQICVWMMVLAQKPHKTQMKFSFEKIKTLILA